MKEVFELLLLLGIAVISNILCGLYLSIGVKQFTFDKSKLINGVVKALCVSLAFIGLAYIIYEVPSLSEAIGIEPKAMIISAIGLYAGKTAVSLCNILGIKKEETVKKVETTVAQTVKEELETEYVDM